MKINENLGLVVFDALKEAQTILNYYIENFNEINFDDKNTLLCFINSLKVDCQCDDYNGFDCGCKNRMRLFEKAKIYIENAFN